MAEKIQLEVVTPERRVLAEPVDMVTVPGLGGELGILPGHTPLISQLQTGVLTYVQEGKSFPLHVSGGFVEVRDDMSRCWRTLRSVRMRSTPRAPKSRGISLRSNSMHGAVVKRSWKALRLNLIDLWCAYSSLQGDSFFSQRRKDAKEN